MLSMTKSFTWVRACVVAGAALTVALLYSPFVARGATVTYTNPSCASFTTWGTPPNLTVTCVGSGEGAALPSCSTPTVTPATPPSGTSPMITSNCTNAPTSYVWTGKGCTQTTTANCGTGLPSGRSGNQTTFTVTATNAGGSSAPASVTVTWGQ